MTETTERTSPCTQEAFTTLIATNPAGDTEWRSLLTDAEAHRHEPPTFDTVPVCGLMDYGSAGAALDLAVHHLDESIPNGQKRRTELAARLAVIGLSNLLWWLRAKGYRVPTITVRDWV